MPITEKSSECLFYNLEKGVYAIILLHDENSNRKVDYNFTGIIPKEGYGASQNKLNLLSPPSFEENAFEFDGTSSPLTIEIKVSY